jgi:LytS/YehU family sensor histidine kinase
LLDGYMKINDVGSAPRDDVRVDVPPDVMNALVPRMMLPTIAERVARQTKNGHRGPRPVTVRAERQDELLRLELTVIAGDRGNGQWREHEIEQQLDGTREQLQRLYGRSQSIELSANDATVSAVMTIPFREALAGEAPATALIPR